MFICVCFMFRTRTWAPGCLGGRSRGAWATSPGPLGCPPGWAQEGSPGPKLIWKSFVSDSVLEADSALGPVLMMMVITKMMIMMMLMMLMIYGVPEAQGGWGR